MDLATVMQRLCDSEINCSASCMWDSGWNATLGDEMNGFAEGNCKTLPECAHFLHREALWRFPESEYAGG